MLEEEIRNLAKSSHYQHLYRTCKDIPSFHMFDNVSNFSGLQTLLLYWVRIYNIISDENLRKEHDNLNDDVINDHVRFDAFLYYRQRKQEKELQKQINDQKVQKYDKGKGKMKYREFPIYRGATNGGDS